MEVKIGAWKWIGNFSETGCEHGTVCTISSTQLQNLTLACLHIEKLPRISCVDLGVESSAPELCTQETQT